MRRREASGFDVDIGELLATREDDFREAAKELVKQRNHLFKSQADVERYMKKHNLVWHHVENSSVLQLIRHDIHTPGRGGIYHWGGRSTH
jgi:hypothetical protein